MSKEDIVNQECSKIANYLQCAYSQNPNRSPEENARLTKLAENLSALCADENLDSDSALLMLLDELDQEDPVMANECRSYSRVAAWFDIILHDDYSFSETKGRKYCANAAPVSDSAPICVSEEKPKKEEVIPSSELLCI